MRPLALATDPERQRHQHGEDPGAGARTDPWQRLEQAAERVGDEDLLDLRGETVATGVDPVELDGEQIHASQCSHAHYGDLPTGYRYRQRPPPLR
jgi:hypothetical protein